jgi:hypothetical protein
MPKKYDQEAIEKARGLYCKYGGQNYDAIEREMRKQYPGWRKTNLMYRKERDGREKLGWVEEYGFEKSLKLHMQKLTEAVNDDEQDLYLGIKAVRKELQVKVQAGQATKDELYQYRDFCKLEIEARKNLDLSRDNLETFVAGYEKLLIWLGDLDPAAAKALVKHGDKLAEMAQVHYGTTETEFAGASNREDEGGDEPFSLLDRD